MRTVPHQSQGSYKGERNANLGMPVEESRRGVVEPLCVRDPRSEEGGSCGGLKREGSCCCCKLSGLTFTRGSVEGDMLGCRGCTNAFQNSEHIEHNLLCDSAMSGCRACTADASMVL